MKKKLFGVWTVAMMIALSSLVGAVSADSSLDTPCPLGPFPTSTRGPGDGYFVCSLIVGGSPIQREQLAVEKFEGFYDWENATAAGQCMSRSEVATQWLCAWKRTK